MVFQALQSCGFHNCSFLFSQNPTGTCPRALHCPALPRPAPAPSQHLWGVGWCCKQSGPGWSWLSPSSACS